MEATNIYHIKLRIQYCRTLQETIPIKETALNCAHADIQLELMIWYLIFGNHSIL